MSKSIALPELKIETEDDVLEKAVRNTKTQVVGATSSARRSTAIQSHQARAWTSAGNVD